MKKEKINEIKLKFRAVSTNESFARIVTTGFLMPYSPTVEELADIKTAVSEAVTNAIVHGYRAFIGEITMEAEIVDGKVHINVFDNGIGIENLQEALEPFYTTRADDERSGMGFTIMKSFMDDVKVESEKGVGTTIYMTKKICPTSKNECK